MLLSRRPHYYLSGATLSPKLLLYLMQHFLAAITTEMPV